MWLLRLKTIVKNKFKGLEEPIQSEFEKEGKF